MPKIITVTGPISPEEMGLTLPHEHIMVDFAGAGNRDNAAVPAGAQRVWREDFC